jgi:MFS family permease
MNNHLGWSIVFISFVADALCLGARALFVIIILFWQKEFGWTTTQLSGIISLAHIMQGIFTPISGYASDILPPDIVVGGGLIVLSVSLGLMATVNSLWSAWIIAGGCCGISFGLLNLNVYAVAVTKAMSKERQGLAVGIATSGSTFGQFTLIPLFALLPNWRVGYLWMCGATALLILPSIVLLRISRKRREKVLLVLSTIKDAQRDTPTATVTSSPSSSICSKRLKALICSWPYAALTIAFFICGITTTGFIETHLVSVSVHRGFSIEVGAAAFAVLCAVNGFSMILAGYLSDRYSRTLLLGLIFLGRGVAYLILILAIEKDQVWLFTFAVLFGLCDYSVVPPVISLVTTHAGAESVGVGVGILLAWHSLGASLGALLGGSLFDEEGNYQSSLVLCALLCVVASVVVVSIRPEPMFRSKNGSGARGGGGKDDALSVEMKRKDVEVEEKVVEITL